MYIGIVGSNPIETVLTLPSGRNMSDVIPSEPVNLHNIMVQD